MCLSNTKHHPQYAIRRSSVYATEVKWLMSLKVGCLRPTKACSTGHPVMAPLEEVSRAVESVETVEGRGGAGVPNPLKT
jgi:hypothetical protein